MKIASMIARYLLGLLFTVFGLNGFLHFIHKPPPTTPLALQFFRSCRHLALCCILLCDPGFGRTAPAVWLFRATRADAACGCALQHPCIPLNA